MTYFFSPSFLFFCRYSILIFLLTRTLLRNRDKLILVFSFAIDFSACLRKARSRQRCLGIDTIRATITTTNCHTDQGPNEDWACSGRLWALGGLLNVELVLQAGCVGGSPSVLYGRLWGLARLSVYTLLPMQRPHNVLGLQVARLADSCGACVASE